MYHKNTWEYFRVFDDTLQTHITYLQTWYFSQIFFKFEILYLSFYDESKHRINFSSTIQLTTFIECKKFYEKDAWLSGRASFKFNLHKSDDKHQRKVFSSLKTFRQTSVLYRLFLHHKCSWYWQWKKVIYIVIV